MKVSWYAGLRMVPRWIISLLFQPLRSIRTPAISF
jgi:hypothetical protein